MRIYIYMLDVGHGDCVVIQFVADGNLYFGDDVVFTAAGEPVFNPPSHEGAPYTRKTTVKRTYTVIIDGGNAGNGEALKNFLSQYGLIGKKIIGNDGEYVWKTVDLVVISHMHEDHFLGISELLGEYANYNEEIILEEDIPPFFAAFLGTRFILPYPFDAVAHSFADALLDVTLINTKKKHAFIAEHFNKVPPFRFMYITPHNETPFPDEYSLFVGDLFSLAGPSTGQLDILQALCPAGNIGGAAFINLFAGGFRLVTLDSVTWFNDAQPSANNHSIVLFFGCGDFTYLTSGDLENICEAQVAEAHPVVATACKISHHGGASATPMIKLRKHRPQVLTVSLNPGKYNNPSTAFLAVVSRYKEIAVDHFQNLILTGYSSAPIFRALEFAVMLYHFKPGSIDLQSYDEMAHHAAQLTFEIIKDPLIPQFTEMLRDIGVKNICELKTDILRDQINPQILLSENFNLFFEMLHTELLTLGEPSLYTIITSITAEDSSFNHTDLIYMSCAFYFINMITISEDNGFDFNLIIEYAQNEDIAGLNMHQIEQELNQNIAVALLSAILEKLYKENINALLASIVPDMGVVPDMEEVYTTLINLCRESENSLMERLTSVNTEFDTGALFKCVCNLTGDNEQEAYLFFLSIGAVYIEWLRLYWRKPVETIKSLLYLFEEVEDVFRYQIFTVLLQQYESSMVTFTPSPMMSKHNIEAGSFVFDTVLRMVNVILPSILPLSLYDFNDPKSVEALNYSLFILFRSSLQIAMDDNDDTNIFMRPLFLTDTQVVKVSQLMQEDKTVLPVDNLLAIERRGTITPHFSTEEGNLSIDIRVVAVNEAGPIFMQTSVYSHGLINDDWYFDEVPSVGQIANPQDDTKLAITIRYPASPARPPDDPVMQAYLSGQTFFAVSVAGGRENFVQLNTDLLELPEDVIPDIPGNEGEAGE